MKKPPSISMSKKLFPILATTGVIFISNSSFAENSEKVSPSENTVQQLETMTFTASRADEVQEKSKQVTKLDEKQIELLKNCSSGNIATVLAKAVMGLQSPLTNFRTDALSGDIHQYFTGSLDNLDYALDFGYQRIGSPYDASGDRVAPEPSQGDLYDADAYSIGGKIGYHIDDNQYLQLAAS